MKRNDRILIVVETVLAVSTILSFLFLKDIPLSVLNIGFIILIGGISFFTRRFFGTKKINGLEQRPIMKIVCIVLMAALIICFNVGLVVGFSRTFFPLNFQKILGGVVPVLLLSVFMELLRSSTVVAMGENRKHIVVFVIVFSLIDVVLEINIGSLSNIENVFVTVCTIVLPAIASQMLLSFLNIHAGMKVSLLYRLITSLYLYILPIVPSLGNYLYSVVWVVIPYIIFNFSKKTVINIYEKERVDIKQKHLSFSILSVPLFVFVATIIALVSGIFDYKMIAIATGSMDPTFSRGDAVIYEKTNLLSVGDVLAFVDEGKIVTHRIIKSQGSDDDVVYITQGDANNEPDDMAVKTSQVLGKVKYVVKYLGFPTVWINEKIGNII